MPKCRSAEKDEKIARLYNAGYTDEEIAAETGYKSRVSICDWRRQRGLPPNRKSKNPRGTPPRETSMEAIARITREAKERGMTYGQYMLKYGGA